MGWATSKRLKELGVVSVSDLQQFPCSRLEEELGVALATTIHQLSFGVDHSSVVTYSRPQVCVCVCVCVGPVLFDLTLHIGSNKNV